MNSTYCLACLLSVTLTGFGQKYLALYNTGDYQKAIAACEKILEKDKSDLQVYLYKSLAYAQLGAGATTRETHKSAAEKSLSALQLIFLRDKDTSFIRAHALQVDSVLTLTRTAASRFYDENDLWHAGRIIESLMQFDPGAEDYYLFSKILMQQGDKYNAIMQLNYAARTLYFDYKNGNTIDSQLLPIYPELAVELYRTGDLNSAITIMDRCLRVFPDAGSRDAYIGFIQFIADTIEDNAADAVYITLLNKLDSLEAAGKLQCDQLRWELLSNRLTAFEANGIGFCEATADINALYAMYDATIGDSLIAFLNQKIVETTIVQFKFGEGSVAMDTCYLYALEQLEKAEPALAETLSAAVEAAWRANDLHTASILLYAFESGAIERAVWERWRNAVVEELHRQMDQVGYDAELRKLLFLFEGDPEIKLQNYTSDQELALRYIREKKWSAAGAIIRQLMLQNPDDPATRQLQKEWVIADYKNTFLNLQITDEILGWTGSYAACDPGDISPEAQQRFIDALNYFRRLAGLPDSCVLDDSLNRLCQSAAFVMDVNDDLSHSINNSWQCFTANAGNGASNSNLSWGYHSVSALYGQIEDSGGGNTSVGHRRWILNPYRRVFGHGSTPEAMALWALGSANCNYSREITDAYAYQYVLWPPQGYVPADFTCSRWSVSLPNADFSDVTITVTQGKKNIPVTVLPIENGYGLPTVVFQVPDIDYWLTDAVTYHVAVSGIRVNGETDVQLRYEVTFIPMGS